MIKLPASTAFNKKIPKQKFYSNLKVSNKVVKLFTDQIDTIHWTNKLAPDTLNVDGGTNVAEIQFIEINLKRKSLDKELITLIDQEIPYHIVFVVRYLGHGQLWIAYKKDAKNSGGKFKVNRYYKTEWLPFEKLTLKFEGLNLDQIYEGFLLQIAGGELTKYEEEDLKTAIDRSNEVEKLKKAIVRLEKKIHREKQYNQQVKMMGELHKLKLELELLEERRA